ANSPVRNSSHAVFCELPITEFGAYPSSSQDVQSSSASTASGESSSVSSAPDPQNQGRNWNVPSSVPIPAKVIPRCPASSTCCSAAVSESQSVMESGSTPASSRISAL